jgi:DNA modification methylase
MVHSHRLSITPEPSIQADPAEFVRTQVLAESWEFSDAITDTLTHNIHRYSGKFIPQIAARAIETLSKKGDTVLDVFCGSGTTLLEAARLQRNAIGIDLSPLAVLISKVKTTPIEPHRLMSLKADVTQAVSSHRSGANGDLFLSEDRHRPIVARSNKANDEWHQKWYGENALCELVIIDEAISGLRDADLRDVSVVALSNILRRVSRAHSGYPNVMFDKNSKDNTLPIKLFLREIEALSRQISELANIKEELSNTKILHANSTCLPLESETIDAVITHPPYIGSIPYAEYGALSLKWLGVDPKELDKNLTGGRRQSKGVVERFSEDYEKILAEAYRVLKEGKFLFLMVGNPVVKGQLIDLSAMTHEMAMRAGFKCIVTTSRNGVNRRANKMGAEALLFFQK